LIIFHKTNIIDSVRKQYNSVGKSAERQRRKAIGPVPNGWQPVAVMWYDLALQCAELFCLLTEWWIWMKYFFARLSDK